ncbi:hypothetical protein EV138_3840 [Kribbella voronezhensis]|uniref:Uncharacterized protein n=1 Tax=Kribbella voronezhensis TaxID=2512212 RepID=A0A4R7TDT2_9ACTN|nr:hypothetical protein [Kribbella voronezhensis]TDU90255.1 hypothetical protein EV138_3840 [Kribbella voronezhensis]
MNTEEDYTGLLQALREDNAPDTDGISIDRAIQDGRRTVRRRRVAGGAAVIAVIAAVSTAPLLLNGIGNPDDGVAVAPSPGSVQFFGVWSQAFEAGSAGGFTPYRYKTGRYWQDIALRPVTAGLGKEAWAGVTMLAQGIEPGTSDNSWAEKSPIANIEGRPAFLLDQAKAGVRIAWQYADNSWGIVTVTGSSAAQVDRARQIAESVHRGAGRPVTVPFTVSRAAIGSELEVTSVSAPIGTGTPDATPTEYLLGLDVGAGTESGSVIESVGSGPVPPAERQPQLTVGITTPPPAFTPTTTVNGRPAEVHADDNYTRFSLTKGYLAIAEQSPLSSYLTNFTAIAASIKLTGANGDPVR